MWALGLVLWMFDRDRSSVIEWLKSKFGAKSAALVDANIAALNAGHGYGETAELGRPLNQVRIAPGQCSPTSRAGTRSPSTPFGSVERPTNPCGFALGAGGRFVARAYDLAQKELPDILKRAHAASSGKKRDLQALLGSGDTWSISRDTPLGNA
jgi:hypothetical protein